MENTKPNNPYVHPIQENTLTEYCGMTLRDHFAGLAMQTYIQDNLQYKRENANGWSVDTITETAYVFADAMLRKRESI